MYGYLDRVAWCRLWAGIMRQWISDARSNEKERHDLAKFLDVDNRQLDRILRQSPKNFLELTR